MLVLLAHYPMAFFKHEFPCMSLISLSFLFLISFLLYRFFSFWFLVFFEYIRSIFLHVNNVHLHAETRLKDYRR